MKKVIIAMAVLAIAVPAMAADISASHSEDFGCGACHSAHVTVPLTIAGAIKEDLSGVVPLWGRTVTTETLKAYGQGTTGAGSTIRGEITPGAPTNESALCMSCHDGATNTAGVGHGISGTVKADGYVDTNAGHPISFDYDGATFTSGRFNEPPIASGTSTAVLENGRVECTSCHDIHGTNLNSANFAIRATALTAASDENICKSCHLK